MQALRKRCVWPRRRPCRLAEAGSADEDVDTELVAVAPGRVLSSFALNSARRRRIRSITSPKSARTSIDSIPYAEALRISAAVHAERMNAFDGTQP